MPPVRPQAGIASPGLAGRADPARPNRIHDDLLARLPAVDAVAKLDDLPGYLVPEDASDGYARIGALANVQIGLANPRRQRAQQDPARGDRGDGHLNEIDPCGTEESDGAHAYLPFRDIDFMSTDECTGSTDMLNIPRVGRSRKRCSRVSRWPSR